MGNSLQVDNLVASTSNYSQTRAAFSPGTSLLLRQTVCRSRSSMLMTPAPANASPASPELTTAIHNLLQIVAELRSPQGGWPPELAQNPETLTPYVSEEAYELLDALRQTRLPQIMPAVDSALLQLNGYCTVDGLISPLLWALFRSAYEIMRLIEGIEVEITPPIGIASGTVQTGIVRLASLLVLKTATGDGPPGPVFDHRAIDLVTQASPDVEHWLDAQVLIQSLESGIWPQAAEAKTLLSMIEHQIQQQMPLLMPWIEGLAVDCLLPNSPWQQGVLQLQFGLALLPLSPAQPSVTPEVIPEIIPEVLPAERSATVADRQPLTPTPPPIEDSGTMAPPVTLTILDLFADVDPPQTKADASKRERLDALDSSPTQLNPTTPSAYPEPKADEDLFSNFAGQSLPLPSPPRLPPSSEPNVNTEANEDLFSDFSNALDQPPSPGPSSAAGIESSKVDPRLFELFGIAEPFQSSDVEELSSSKPEDPGRFTTNQTLGLSQVDAKVSNQDEFDMAIPAVSNPDPAAIARQGKAVTTALAHATNSSAVDTTQPVVALPPFLQSWISFSDETWLQQFLDTLAYQQLIDRLNQSNHQFAEATVSDYDTLLHDLIAATYLTVDRLQSNTGFFQQGFWHQSMLLSDWISRLWWYIVRSSNQIMQWIGGMPAGWLHPGNGWQTGTLQWVIGLKVEAGDQTQRLDLTTGMPLALMPPAPDTILALDIVSVGGNFGPLGVSVSQSPSMSSSGHFSTLAMHQQYLQALLSETSPALDGLFQGTQISLYQLTAEADETAQTGWINLYLVPRLTQS
ncbi:MAG: hypothetical protein AAFX95_18770 [Cyanobacteria bacterium J06639_16]